MLLRWPPIGAAASALVFVAAPAVADVSRTETPGGGRIAFVEGSRGAVYTVRPDGRGKRRVTPPGRPHDLIEGPLSWSPDGRKLVYSLDDSGYPPRSTYEDLYVVKAAGGKPRRVTESGSDERNPTWSRDGKRIAYDLYEDGYWIVSLVNPDGTHNHGVTPGINFHGPAWARDGRLLAFADRDSVAWTMNLNHRHLRPRRVAKDLSGSLGPRFEVVVAWAPRGHRLAFISGFDIWVADIDKGTRQRVFTTHDFPTENLAWSPDGSRIAFALRSKGGERVCVVNADGTGLKQLTDDRSTAGEPSWSPDGRQIAFTQEGEIYVMNADGTQQRNVSRSPKPDSAPTWSPRS